jgi:hypothetical protein
LGDVLRLPKRHPAWRRREAQSGSRKKLTCSGHATNSPRYRDLGSTCLCRGRKWLDLNGVATARRKPNIVSFAAGRQCRWSTCMERENLAGDGKGKGASGSNREAESTDAPERGGLPRSSDEAGVMLVERRGRVIAVELGPTGGAGRSPKAQRKAAAFARWHEPDDARVSSPDL